MSDTNHALLAASVLGQWFASAGMIWLIWWAAQSRDAMPIRVIAMVLVIVPSVLWPILNFMMMADTSSIASRAALFGLIGGIVAISRAVLLVVWAALSKDRAYLRVGGGVIAGLLIVGIAIQALPGLMRL